MTVAFTIAGLILGGWVGMLVGWWAAMETWKRARIDYWLDLSSLSKDKLLTVTDMFEAWEKHIANWPQYFAQKNENNTD